MGYKTKYRGHLVKMLDEVYDELNSFYEYEYIACKERSDVLGAEVCLYRKNEDGLFVLESVNGDSTMSFENIVNLTGLETFSGNVFTVQPYVVGFIYGRYLNNKKNMIEISKDTGLTILDINFNVLSQFTHRLSLPQKCFNLDSIEDKDNILDLADMSKVDFTKFIVSDSALTLRGVKGIYNRCYGSTFGALNLTGLSDFYGASVSREGYNWEAYFISCHIKSLIISNTTLINAACTLFKDCVIDELVIYDKEGIDLGSELLEIYREKMADNDCYVFNRCEITNFSIVSNIILSNSFSLCTINTLNISSKDNSVGIHIDMNAFVGTSFTSSQSINVSRLAQSAFNSCVVNAAENNRVSRPFVLYVKDIPDDGAVADAVNGFMDCVGNYEVLYCGGDGVSSNVEIFNESGELTDDAIYNTIYAMLFRGATHYIQLPKDLLLTDTEE